MNVEVNTKLFMQILYNFEAVGIIIVGVILTILDMIMYKRYKDQRWVRIPRSIASAGITITFILNLIGVLVEDNGISVPTEIGRIIILLFMVTVMSGTIYNLRGKSSS